MHDGSLQLSTPEVGTDLRKRGDLVLCTSDCDWPQSSRGVVQYIRCAIIGEGLAYSMAENQMTDIGFIRCEGLACLGIKASIDRAASTYL